MSAASRRLTLYGHSYCSLCEAMHAQLLGLTGELALEIELVDIHDDPELEARFGERVPVLCDAGDEICHHFLDESELRRYLSGG
jgi:thiol-disulfide isomerase/thioredoxin